MHDIDHALEVAVVMRAGLGIGMDVHGACPELLRADAGEVDRRLAVHAGRLRGIRVERSPGMTRTPSCFQAGSADVGIAVVMARLLWLSLRAHCRRVSLRFSVQAEGAAGSVDTHGSRSLAGPFVVRATRESPSEEFPLFSRARARRPVQFGAQLYARQWLFVIPVLPSRFSRRARSKSPDRVCSVAACAACAAHFFQP